MTDLWKVERRLRFPPDNTPQQETRRVLEIGGVTVVPVFCSIIVVEPMRFRLRQDMARLTTALAETSWPNSVIKRPPPCPPA
jgi:hypothetical protein